MPVTDQCGKSPKRSEQGWRRWIARLAFGVRTAAWALDGYRFAGRMM